MINSISNFFTGGGEVPFCFLRFLATTWSGGAVDLVARRSFCISNALIQGGRSSRGGAAGCSVSASAATRWKHVRWLGNTRRDRARRSCSELEDDACGGLSALPRGGRSTAATSGRHVEADLAAGARRGLGAKALCSRGELEAQRGLGAEARRSRGELEVRRGLGRSLARGDLIAPTAS